MAHLLGKNGFLGMATQQVSFAALGRVITRPKSVMHDSRYILIPVPFPISGKFKSLILVPISIPTRIPLIPFRFRFQPQHLDSSSDSYSNLSIPCHGFKVVLEAYCRCPDSHDLSECHHLYDLGRHI